MQRRGWCAIAIRFASALAPMVPSSPLRLVRPDLGKNAPARRPSVDPSFLPPPPAPRNIRRARDLVSVPLAGRSAFGWELITSSRRTGPSRGSQPEAASADTTPLTRRFLTGCGGGSAAMRKRSGGKAGAGPGGAERAGRGRARRSRGACAPGAAIVGWVWPAPHHAAAGGGPCCLSTARERPT